MNLISEPNNILFETNEDEILTFLLNLFTVDISNVR